MNKKKTSPYLLMHRYTHKIPNYKPMVAEPIILIYAEIMDCRISVLFSSVDCICKKPSRAWKKQYNKPQRLSR